jgi:hypothetical protein
VVSEPAEIGEAVVVGAVIVNVVVFVTVTAPNKRVSGRRVRPAIFTMSPVVRLCGVAVTIVAVVVVCALVETARPGTAPDPVSGANSPSVLLLAVNTV